MSLEINETEQKARRDRERAGFGKFPSIFRNKLDYSKPDRDFIRDYVAKNLPTAEEDDITIDFVINLIFDEHVTPEDLCVQLAPFLDEDRAKSVHFTRKLWKVLLAAQKERNGIPAGMKREERKEETIVIRRRRVGRERWKDGGERGRWRGRGGRERSRSPERDAGVRKGDRDGREDDYRRGRIARSSGNDGRSGGQNDGGGRYARRTDDWARMEHNKPGREDDRVSSRTPPRERSGSITTPRKRSGSTTPPRERSGSVTPPRRQR